MPPPLSPPHHTPVYDGDSCTENPLIPLPGCSLLNSRSTLPKCDSFQIEMENFTARKISQVSVYSEPLMDGSQNVPRQSCLSPDDQLHLSLPNLSTTDVMFPSITIAESDSYFLDKDTYLSTSSTFSNAAAHQDNLSPSIPQNIPKGVQTQLGRTMDECPGLLSHRSSHSIPSSPSAASVASSTVSAQDMLDESPSVRELCEMLSESANVQQTDFSHMTLTGLCVVYLGV